MPKTTKKPKRGQPRRFGPRRGIDLRIEVEHHERLAELAKAHDPPLSRAAYCAMVLRRHCGEGK